MNKNALFLLSLGLTGCGGSQTTQVKDVTKPETLVLHAGMGQSTLQNHSLQIRIHGQIDGVAVVWGTEMDTKILKGTFDYTILRDFYDDTCAIHYAPTNVTSGHVMVDYEFWD